MSTTRRVLADATARLAAAGVGTPRVDAELLLAHALDLERSRLLLVDTVTPAQAARYEEFVQRRVAREPLQHIVGTAPFRHLGLAVGAGVFVPRPETELLVDAVLATLHASAAPLAVDLCSGSGALALALAAEVPTARVLAVEQPGSAVAWLRRNAVGSRVEVVIADVADPALLPALRGQVDVVVSNPPYVPVGISVEAEVHADPETAVFAGTDGLALMPAVIARAAELLRPEGVAAIEHDDTHGALLPALLVADGRWRNIVDHQDLAGRPRYVTAVRS